MKPWVPLANSHDKNVKINKILQCQTWSIITSSLNIHLPVGKGVWELEREEKKEKQALLRICHAKEDKTFIFSFKAKDGKGGESEHSDLLSVYSIVCITSV